MSKPNTEAFNETKSNFGRLGWRMVVVVSLAFFFNAGIQTDGLNISVPAMAELHGWGTAQLLGFSTLAGWVAVLGSIFFGKLTAKIGPRLVMIITLSVLGVSVILWGRVTAVWQYAAILCVIMSVLNGYVYIAGPALLGNWFPRKKALAMGWGNMGANASTALYVPAFTWLVSTRGITTAFTIVGGIVLVICLYVFFFVKDYPELMGAFPDNNKELTKADVEKFKEVEEHYKKTSPWTFKKLLTTRQVWQIGIGGGGVLMMITVGMLSQFVPRLMSMGYEKVEAVALMSVMAILATPVGYLVGFISQKLGVKKACMVFYGWTIAALLVGLIPGTIPLYISLFLTAGVIAGSNDFMITLGLTVFGRYDYASASSVIMPINSVVRTFGYAIVGVLASRTGGFTVPYLVLAGCAVVGMLIVATLDDRCIGRGEVQQISK